MKKINLLVEIYLTFFKLGSISFGGGYAMIPLIEREVVEKKKWVDKDKIVDIFAVSESLPGAIALNSSAFAGYSIAGIPGAIAALLGNLTPSVFVVMLLTILFIKFSTYAIVKSAFRGIYPAIAGLVLYAAYKIGLTAIKDKTCIVIAVCSFIAAFWFAPVPIIISGAIAGIVITSFKYTMHVKNSSTAETKDGGF